MWSTTERRHTQRYNCCGLVTVETEEHTWEKGVCTLCAYRCVSHTGGTATCVKKAVCEDCGEAYGEVDGGNHEALVRVPAKAAAEDAEGNSEYWYCSACGKYYGDEKGTKEITEADTVIVKLPQTPQTGDSGLTLWLTLLLGAAMAAAVMGKKKKREA